MNAIPSVFAIPAYPRFRPKLAYMPKQAYESR